MFKRKIPLTNAQKLREMLWPKMGWIRVLKLYRARIIRLASPARTIAANMAGGAAMSFTPFFGLHIFAAMGFSWLIGAGVNVIAAVTGSFLGNPWTFPFLFFTSNRVGQWVLDAVGYNDEVMEVDVNLISEQQNTIHNFLFDHFWEVFFPTAVGGTIMAIVSWPIFYYSFYYMVKGAQQARRLRLRRKQLHDFQESAAPPKEYKDTSHKDQA